MWDPQIQARLRAAIERDGRPYRHIARAAGLGANYVTQLMNTEREPGVDQFLALCRTLNVSVGSIIFGRELSAADEALAARIASLPPERREVILQLLRSWMPEA